MKCLRAFLRWLVNRVTSPQGIDASLVLLALLTAGFGAMRGLEKSPIQRDARGVDEVVLMFFVTSGGLLLLRNVQSMSFGNYKIEFSRQLQDLQTKVENAQSLAMPVQRPSQPVQHPVTDPTKDRIGASVVFSPQPGDYADDPWRGVFGGSSSNSNRLLTATVSRSDANGMYRVQMQVKSLDQQADPLRGSVQFFLHDTFSNDRPSVRVTPSGVAELNLSAWGAFTVGALADNGRTKLELNLAEMKEAPVEFRNL